MLCQFLLYSKVNQLYVYIYPLFFGFPSHLGHHRVLSGVSCAIQQVLISYLFYTQQCMYVSPNLPVHPTHPPCPLGIHSLFSTSVSVFLLRTRIISMHYQPLGCTHSHYFAQCYLDACFQLVHLISLIFLCILGHNLGKKYTSNNFYGKKLYLEFITSTNLRSPLSSTIENG